LILFNINWEKGKQRVGFHIHNVIGVKVLSKSRKDVWGEPFDIETTPSVDSWEAFEEEDPTKYLEEAHEALSKFVNKSKKREKTARPPKRGESWQ
jgi:hypothetical protein